MIASLTTALLLGLIGGLVPGPVLTAIFTEILQTDFKKSLRIVFIAVGVESFVAIISLVVISAFGFPESFFRILSIVGAAILIWIASSLWKIRSLDTSEQVHFGFWKLTALIMSNGVLWTFWITVAIPLAVELGSVFNWGEYIFMAVNQLGWLISTTLVAFIFSRFRQILSKPVVVPIAFKIFALTFVYFALNMLHGSAKFFELLP